MCPSLEAVGRRRRVYRRQGNRATRLSDFSQTLTEWKQRNSSTFRILHMSTFRAGKRIPCTVETEYRLPEKERMNEERGGSPAGMLSFTAVTGRSSGVSTSNQLLCSRLRVLLAIMRCEIRSNGLIFAVSIHTGTSRPAAYTHRMSCLRERRCSVAPQGHGFTKQQRIDSRSHYDTSWYW